MTKAKITKADGFKCAPGGAVVETFAFGEIVEGKVAQWALDARAASRLFDPREETKVEAPAETKKAAPRKKKAAGK